METESPAVEATSPQTVECALCRDCFMGITKLQFSHVTGQYFQVQLCKDCSQDADSVMYLTVAHESLRG